MISFPMAIYLEVGFLDYIVIWFFVFNFLRNLHTVFIIVPFTFPPAVHKSSFFSHPHYSFFLFLFDSNDSNKCKVISHCGFGLYFPND